SAWRIRCRTFRRAAAPCWRIWRAKSSRAWRRSANKPTFRSRSEIKTRGVPAWSDTPVVTKIPEHNEKNHSFRCNNSLYGKLSEYIQTPGHRPGQFRPFGSPERRFLRVRHGRLAEEQPPQTGI